MQFERRDYPTIMSGLVVRYHEAGAHGDIPSRQIAAGREGVTITGSWFITEFRQIEAIHAVLMQAQMHHLVLYQDCGPLGFEGEPACVVRYVRPGFDGSPDIVLWDRTVQEPAP